MKKETPLIKTPDAPLKMAITRTAYWIRVSEWLEQITGKRYNTAHIREVATGLKKNFKIANLIRSAVELTEMELAEKGVSLREVYNGKQ